MCNIVVPVRTCSKCHQREPLFGCDDGFARDHEKAGIDKRAAMYMDVAQDCYSRTCVFSSEHPKKCSHCWLTCRRWHGKTREIHGGSFSYVCHSCAPRARCQPAWKPPRPIRPSGTLQSKVVVAATHGFPGVAKILAR